jgi:hypothetical protein
VLPAGTGQDDAETINSEVQLVFRKKTRGQVIGAELQEGFTHIGTAMSEAGRLAAEQLGPRVEAAREAATPAFEAAQKAVVPKVAAAVAVAAPAVASAKESVASARDTIGPRVEAAREAAAPRVAAAVQAAQKAAHDLAPHVEAAQKSLKDDVVPRIGAAQVAALAYATPRVSAARDAVTPALESARETLAAGVESARSEIDARRAEIAAGAAESTRKARKSAKKARKVAAAKRQEFEKKAAATAKQVKRRTGVEPAPRRWPWLFLALALGGAAFTLLRRKKNDDWTPAPAGDGPVPSYREDPVPTSPSDSGKTVSAVPAAPGDATPPDTDLGMQTAQLAEGETGTEEGAPGAGTPGGATGGAANGDDGQAPGTGGDKA